MTEDVRWLLLNLRWNVTAWLVRRGVLVLREEGGWFRDCRWNLRPWTWGRRQPYWQ
jgi:hypothetical protein